MDSHACEALDVFDAYPAPTFIVDDDLRLLRVNRAARALLGEPEPTLLMKRGGEALRCVHSTGEGGCGRQRDCKQCVIRNSVDQALTTRSVHRARTFMRLRRDGDESDVCMLVSASAVEREGTLRAVLTVEDVSDVQLKDQVLRTEAALREAHERAASLARFPEENPDPVLRIASDLSLAYANSAAYSALPDLPLAVGERVPPELAVAARRALDERTRIWIELASAGRTFALSFSVSGNEVNVYGNDVTEQRWAFEQLAAEKERLRVTLGSIGDAVIATDDESRVTLLNGVAEELTGWSAGAATGRHVDEVFRIISEETRQPAVNPIRRVLAEGIVVGLANHTALVARDGSERPIADSAAPIRDAQGRVSGVVLVFRDQTMEREAEEALRESERRVRTMLQAILSPAAELATLELGDVLDADALRSMMRDFHELTRIPMAIIDLEGRVLVGVGWQDICTKFHRVHPETCKHCIDSDTRLSAGVPAGEIRRYKCKNNMWDVATPIHIGGHHAGNVFMGQFFFEDEPIEYDVFRAQAARYGFDEREYLAALDAVPRLSSANVAAGMEFFLKFAGMVSQSSFNNLKLAHAAAERETLLSSVREAKERLEETDRRKDEFLAVLSHELRNPLAPIRNSLIVLDRASSAAQAARARSVIERQVKHLSGLVDDLLDVTRISHGKISLNREHLDLREVVRRTCDDHRDAFEHRDIEMHLDLPFGPVWIDADTTRIAQAVGNVVQNAAKFTPPKGRVTVAVSCRGSHAEVAVRDTGVGIASSDLERIFEPFAQADQGLARTHGGLGLGLALVRKLVELHGGTARARSEGLGTGAEIVIRLPLAGGAPVERPRDVAPRSPGSRSVLVIEDNLDSGESLADVLTLYGHTVQVAADGRSGVTLARELRPDVVLCDIGLPDMPGYDVARAIRSDGALRATRLVALSGYALPEDRERSRAAGFDHHIAKPADVEELMRLLDAEPHPG